MNGDRSGRPASNNSDGVEALQNSSPSIPLTAMKRGSHFIAFFERGNHAALRQNEHSDRARAPD